MSEDLIRYPELDKMYQQYLRDENSAEFICAVSSVYSLGSLTSLARFGHRTTRRAAILAIGFLGDFRDNETVGNALNDPDRAVRMLADHGIRNLWGRQGSLPQQSSIKRLYRLVGQDRMNEAITLATKLIEANPDLGEAWNQRAIAFSAEGNFDAALDDCRETLITNRYHFPAAMGMAHCSMQLNDKGSALSSFRLALQINPDLEGVRNQVLRLEKIVGN